MKQPDDTRARRTALPRPLRDILDPALARLATSEQARAYGAWTRAAGAPIAAAARPGAFFNGVLTVECASSIWANELTYLGGQILARMNDLTPGQPVKRLRFVVARDPRPAGPPEADPAPARPPREPLAGPALDAALAATDGVRDERLREAIRAALRSSGGAS